MRAAWRATSASVTASPPASSARLTAKVSSPGIGASSASQNEREPGRLAGAARPPASGRCRRSPRARPHGPRCRGRGGSARWRSRRPGRRRRSRPGRHRGCAAPRRLLGQLEADGALSGHHQRLVVGPDQDGTVRSAIAAPMASRRPRRDRRRPPRHPARGYRRAWSAGASAGMTIVAGMPSRRAASATPCAWLPEE